MSSTPDSSRPAPTPTAKPRTGAYVAVAVLVLAGQGLLGAALVAQLRHPENTPPATVLGAPAWAIATAGLVSTLAGGLWLRRLV